MNHNGRDTAREARDSAAVRAQELHERHVDLLSEKPPTIDGLRRAREALTEARRRAAAAHRRSAQQHLAAAERHEQRAAVLEVDGHDERAHEHRRAAVKHREAALVAERKAEADTAAARRKE